MDPTTLDLRIQNTKASIEKTKRTLERHEKQREKRSAALKAQGIDITQLSAEGRRAAQNGQNDLYWAIDALEDTIENIESNEKKLSELQEKLSGYQEKKAAEDKRNDIPHIPALEDFLAQWKDKATEHYCLEVRELAAHQKERREKIKQIESKYEFPSIHWREIDEEAKAIGMDSKSFNKAMKMRFTQDIHRLRAEGLPGEPRFDQFLDKMLSDEVRSKTDRAMLRDLLKLHPHWLILWQPQPAPPPAPTYSDIVEFTRSVSRHKAPTSQAEGSEKGGFHGE